MTDKEIIEYVKCKNDIVYFINNYCFIPYFNKKHNIKLHKYQENYFLSINNMKFNICLHSLESGVNTMNQLYILHELIFSFDKSIVLIDVSLKKSKEALSRIKGMMEYLPDFLRIDFHVNNKKCIETKLNTRIKILSNKTLPIGFNIDILILNNFALWNHKNKTNMMVSVLPLMSAIKDSKFIICSIPNGAEYFYKLYSDALINMNLFYPSRIDWFDNPNRNGRWKEKKIDKIGEEKFKKSYGLNF